MIRVELPCLNRILRAEGCFAGNDIWVVIVGGDVHHVGSVSVGIPHKSIAGTGEPSATVSTINVAGHRDDAVSIFFAKRLASEFRCTVSVTCGIHFNNATPSDLGQIINNAGTLLDELAIEIRKVQGQQPT